MVRLVAALLASALLIPAQDWSLDRLFRRPFLWGTWPSQIAWAKHARVAGFLWNAQGQPFRDLYVYNASTKKLIRLTNLEGLYDPINETEAEKDEHRKGYVPPQGGLTSFDISQDGSRAVFSYRGDLFLEHTSGGPVVRITKTKAAEVNPQFSPDGTRLGFTQAGQIYTLTLDGGMIEQRTDVHAPASLTSFKWSPDGKYFAYTVQPTPGRTMPLPIYSGQFVAAPSFPRSVAGDTPTASQYYVVESSGDNPPRLLDTGRGFGFRPPEWSEDSKHLVLVSGATNYKSEDIRVIDVNTGKSKVVFHQTDDRWIEFSDTGWSPSSQQIWFTSDQSGFQHLYTVGADGSNLKQVTRGSWEIHTDTFSHTPQWIGDFIYYSSTANGTAERQLYRVKADGSSAPEQLSQHEGLNIAWISEDGKDQAILQADLKNPFDLYVNGARVTKSPLPDFYNMSWAESRFLTYPSLKDHKPVAARLLIPPGYNPDDPNQKPRPAIVYIHGSGYATSVLKQWGSYQELRFVFNNFLAHEGYPVLEMDYRGSTNYGRDWRSGVYLNMGGPDLDDVLGGVEYLRGLKNIDMSRVGIWGWSYGGFMTAMAMFRAPETFQAGAAFSGVYDWANYNAVYTDERLTTPAENPEAYERSSPIHFSSQLRNHLLLVHGIVDNNVLFQEAVQLSEKLIHEGKHF
ncbi:MAG: prolyl oligopeptidase family serine peptidase, partial [Acidobacteriaceae bacterium]|nr:prolyl oligopeptidase family serine peptidase [Acidobacteriaceae bacterium]